MGNSVRNVLARGRRHAQPPRGPSLPRPLHLSGGTGRSGVSHFLKKCLTVVCVCVGFVWCCFSPCRLPFFLGLRSLFVVRHWQASIQVTNVSRRIVDRTKSGKGSPLGKAGLFPPPAAAQHRGKQTAVAGASLNRARRAETSAATWGACVGGRSQARSGEDAVPGRGRRFRKVALGKTVVTMVCWGWYCVLFLILACQGLRCRGAGGCEVVGIV